jgi:sulfur-carrier protein
MEIIVKGYLTFKQLIGEQRLTFQAGQPPSLRTVIETLLQNHGAELESLLINPNTGRLNPHTAVLVNGKHHTHIEAGMETLLQDGDQIAIFPPVAGGKE